MDLNYKRIVVKLGTSTLTGGTPYLSPPRMVDLVRQMAHLHSQGCELVLVTSGAIAVGRQQLEFPRLPKDIPAKQMLAIVAGGAAGVACLVGLILLIHRRLTEARIRAADITDQKGLVAHLEFALLCRHPCGVDVREA